MKLETKIEITAKSCQPIRSITIITVNLNQETTVCLRNSIFRRKTPFSFVRIEFNRIFAEESEDMLLYGVASPQWRLLSILVEY